MKIAVIGGGITGLTTGLALKKVGFDPEVYERAEQLNEIGAGILLQPNAMKILDWLGLKERLITEGVLIDKMEICNSRLTPIKPLKRAIVSDAEGNQTLAIHRARLQSVLYGELVKKSKVYLGKKYTGHTKEGDMVRIHFKDDSITAQMVLGADGIHSELRKHLFKDTSLRNARQACWRGVCKFNLPGHLKNTGKEAWGKHKRFGFIRISEDEVYWFAVAHESQLAIAEHAGIQQHLVSLFSDFSPLVHGLIKETSNASIHTSLIYDLKRIPDWHTDTICLLGDAAHATTPNMGQGACQGIEDAFAISQFLSKYPHDPQTAFEQFEKSRRKKVDYVVNNSWRFGKFSHQTIGQALMKGVMKITPERVLEHQMHLLYEVNGL